MSEHGYLSDRRMIGMLLKKHVDVPPDALQEAVAGAVDDMRLSDNLRVKANARDFVLNVEKYNLGIHELVLKLKAAPLERTLLRCKIALLTRDASTDDDIVDEIRREQEQEQLEQRKEQSRMAGETVRTQSISDGGQVILIDHWGISERRILPRPRATPSRRNHLGSPCGFHGGRCVRCTVNGGHQNAQHGQSTARRVRRVHQANGGAVRIP